MARRRRDLFRIILLAIMLPACTEREVGVTDAPVRILAEQAGSGPLVREGDIVTIDYTVETRDGKLVQRERDYRFEVGAGTVISGIDEAVVGMRRGGMRRVLVPPHRHWGSSPIETAQVSIPAKAWLEFEISMQDVE